MHILENVRSRDVRAVSHGGWPNTETSVGRSLGVYLHRAVLCRRSTRRVRNRRSARPFRCAAGFGSTQRRLIPSSSVESRRYDDRIGGGLVDTPLSSSAPAIHCGPKEIVASFGPEASCPTSPATFGFRKEDSRPCGNAGDEGRGWARRRPAAQPWERNGRASGAPGRRITLLRCLAIGWNPFPPRLLRVVRVAFRPILVPLPRVAGGHLMRRRNIGWQPDSAAGTPARTRGSAGAGGTRHVVFAFSLIPCGVGERKCGGGPRQPSRQVTCYIRSDASG